MNGALFILWWLGNRISAFKSAMRKRYVIHVSGLFSYGYVRTQWMGERECVGLSCEADVLKWATKFRFRWHAQALCWMYNRLSIRNVELKKYSVKEYKPLNINRNV